MITEAMTQEELNKSIFSDFELIHSKYFNRVAVDYDKIRRKNKIQKDAQYSKSFEFRTPSKNNWILILSKAPSVERYKGLDSINICSLVYYYTKIGLRVFKIIPSGGLSVFNSHFFSRYNEREELNIDKPLDKVKHYFINNGYSTSKVIEKGSREQLLGICNSGFMLGEFQFNRSWAVYKTYLPRDYAFALQEEIKEGLIEGLSESIEEDLMKEEFDKEGYFYKADVYKGITKS